MLLLRWSKRIVTQLRFSFDHDLPQMENRQWQGMLKK